MSGPEQMRLDSAYGQSELTGHLLIGQLLEVTQQNNHAIASWQLLQASTQKRLLLVLLHQIFQIALQSRHSDGVVSELRAQKRIRVIEGIISLFLPGGDLYGYLQSYKPSQKSSPLL